MIQRSDSNTISLDVHSSSWYSPIEIVRNFKLLGDRYGDIILNAEFKRAREMYAGAVTVLGSYEFSPENKYWIQSNSQSESPDVFAVKLTERENQPILLEINQMEIVELEEHSTSTDVVDFLTQTKLSSSKSYDSNTMIIVLVNIDAPLNYKEINERLKLINPGSNIYIFGRSRADDPAYFTLFSAYPILTKPFEYNILQTAEKYNIPHRISLSRGIGQKISFKPTSLTPVSIYEILGINERKIKGKYPLLEK